MQAGERIWVTPMENRASRNLESGWSQARGGKGVAPITSVESRRKAQAATCAVAQRIESRRRMSTTLETPKDISGGFSIQQKNSLALASWCACPSGLRQPGPAEEATIPPRVRTNWRAPTKIRRCPPDLPRFGARGETRTAPTAGQGYGPSLDERTRSPIGHGRLSLEPHFLSHHDDLQRPIGKG
jgi:hypothetical protein